jgi:hypothetical protein
MARATGLEIMHMPHMPRHPLHDDARQGEGTRAVGPNGQPMGPPSPALRGLQGSALATPFGVNEPATGSYVANQPEAPTSSRATTRLTDTAPHVRAARHVTGSHRAWWPSFPLT